MGPTIKPQLVSSGIFFPMVLAFLYSIAALRPDVGFSYVGYLTPIGCTALFEDRESDDLTSRYCSFSLVIQFSTKTSVMTNLPMRGRASGFTRL